MSKLNNICLLYVLITATVACTGQGTVADAEATPTLEPTATSTVLVRGPCENVLYPITLHRQWIYQKLGDEAGQATPDPLTSRFGITVDEVGDSQATLYSVDMSTGATFETTAECQDGAITNFPIMVIGSILGDFLGGDIHLEYVSGVFAPSQAELDASTWDMHWEGQYIAAGIVSLSTEEAQVELTLEDSPVHMLWQTAGQESVTVPAGTYPDAHKITCMTTLEATMSYGEISGTGTFVLLSTHWFAPYVGMLKTEIGSATLTTFGITIPIELNESVELTETH